MANWGAGNYMIMINAAKKRAEEAERQRKWQSEENETAAWRNLGLGVLGGIAGGLTKAGTAGLIGQLPLGQAKTDYYKKQGAVSSSVVQPGGGLSGPPAMLQAPIPSAVAAAPPMRTGTFPALRPATGPAPAGRFNAVTGLWEQ